MSDLVGNPEDRFSRVAAQYLKACDVNQKPIHVQVSLIITLSLGSLKTDQIISEQCYNEVI